MDDDLGWNDFELRSYDPQIGRFLQNDPYDQFASGYVGMGNDPVNSIDEDGGLVGGPGGFNAVQTLTEVVVTGVRHAAPAVAKIGGATIGKIGLKVLDVATDFIPLVSGAKDIYNGVKSGNWLQAGLGALSIAADVFTLGGSSIAKGAIKTAVREGAEIIAKETAEQVIKEATDVVVKKSLRQRAVRQAWKEEKALVEETGKGTRKWSQKESSELLEKGKVKGYQGHHIKNVKHHPQHAGNPNNIKFVTPKEHLKAHGGNFKNKSTGTFINRKLN